MSSNLIFVNKCNLCEEVVNYVLAARKEGSNVFLSEETVNLLKDKALTFQESLLSGRYCEIAFVINSKKFVTILTEKYRLKYFATTVYRIMSCEVMLKNKSQRFVNFEKGGNEIIIDVK